jgi:spore germination protein
MMKIRWFWCLSLSIFFICGCAEPKILEEMGLITAGGYDYDEKGNIKGTLVELKIDPTTAKDVVIIESQSLSIRGLRTNAIKKTSKELASGQLRVILFGDELLKKGSPGIARTLTRDPSISDITYLAAVEGTAREFLKLKNEHIPDIGIHVYRLIDQNTKSKMMPSATLQEVLHTDFTVGKDAIMPILKKDGNKGVLFSGVAIFRDQKLVGKTSTEQSFYVQLINDKYKSGSKEIEIKNAPSKLKSTSLNKKTVAALDSIRSSSEIKLTNKENLKFDINIKIRARLIDITSKINLGNPKNIALIEKEISKNMKREIEELLSYFQSKNSDVIGLGETYRSSVRNSQLTTKKWRKMFKEAKVNVNLDFKIVRTGVNN